MIAERNGVPVDEGSRPPGQGLLASIREDIGCVRTRDPAARSWLESLLIYPGVHAVISRRIAPWLWNKGAKSAARFVSWIARFSTYVDIHPGSAVEPEPKPFVPLPEFRVRSSRCAKASR